MMKAAQLHLISTGTQPLEQLTEILKRIHSMTDFIHLREKDRSAKELYELILSLADMGVPLSKILVNDRTDVAKAANARGVQRAYHSLPLAAARMHFSELMIGSSVHSVQEARMAEQQGTDFLLFGHVYPTQSKPGAAPRGLEELKEVCRAVNVPVIAIGGITPENAPEALASGAQGVAVLSGILQSKDPVDAAHRYRAALSG